MLDLFPPPTDCTDDCDGVSSASALRCLFHVARVAFCICGYCGTHRGRGGASFLVEVVSGHYCDGPFCSISVLGFSIHSTTK